MLKKLTAIGALTAAIGLFLPAAAQEPLSWAASQQGSQNYTINGTLVSALDSQGVEARLQSFGGSSVYLPRINAGRTDFAAMPSPEPLQAFRGEDVYNGTTHENLRLAAAIVPYATGIMVRADAGIDKIADLEGKRIAYGYTTQPSLQNNVQAMLSTGGLTIDDVSTVLVPTVPSGVDELMAGRVDAALFAVRGGKAVEADAQLGGIRFLPLASTDEAEAALKEYLPTAYIDTVEPSEGQVGIAEPTPLMHLNHVLVTSTHTSEETVQRVLQALKAEEASIQGQRVTDEFAADKMYRPNLGLEYHPGATAFFEKEGLM